MVRSMTGFGRGIYSDDVRTITIEIRAVNHRYCDIYMKMPRRYAFAEEKLKAVMKQNLLRGKIEVSVSVDNFGASDTDIRLNKELARKYYSAMNELKDELGIEDSISLSMMTRIPDIITATPASEDEEEIMNAMLAAASDACEDICRMREIEGEKLAADIMMRGDIIEGIVADISERAPAIEKEYALKFKERISELLENKVEVPEERVMLEAAVFADKANITEELVRLGSHIHQLRDLMSESEGSVGKKIDFLVQEMNREANTIGSKSNDKEITALMLSLKAEIEKIREQVQNIE